MIVKREELYRLACEMPLRHIARQLGVSNTYLARVFVALDVPRAPRGWWSKWAVGTAPPFPPLPPARPGHPTEWSRRGSEIAPIAHFYRRNKVWASARSIGLHPLAAYAVEVFGAAKPVGDLNVLVTRARQAIDLTVSAGALDEAIACASAIFMALEKRGHSIEIAERCGFIRPAIDGREAASKSASPAKPSDWAPYWPTVARIGTTTVGLAIIETQELADMQYAGNGVFVRVADATRRGAKPIVGVTWQEKRWIPTGRLRLVAYSPVFSVPWRTEWKIGDLENDGDALEEVVGEIEASAATLALLKPPTSTPR
jgi:hypothetical protein